jgi:hypothetical protein
MGATIYYKQVNPKDRLNLDVSLPSAFVSAMERAFGNCPWHLTLGNIPTLKGMAAVYEDLQDNPFVRLIEAIERLGEIEVWPEW